ncbi:hypothetical protein [Bradyrhizobium lablabi]|uniref:hypothetical protein n=1 Tax=Bradyrhizobium lablabi TaxID=722472 RepID=UPI001BAB6046|nr:hypothetical protein [Bradyrhizobium lablabi]MBR0694710.1 hypothetical protein [Bradyrhizobium lablabi]
MKDVFCLAVLAGKVLGLMVFVTVLKPDSIGVVQTSTKAVDCRIERSGMQECGSNVFAAISQADAGSCTVGPSAAHC